MAILSILLTVIIIATSILMILIVLVQRPKQEGLGAAFGGGTLDSALGAHTTDILQKITTWLGIIFFVSAIGLAMVKTRQFSATAAQNPLENVETREPEMPGLPPSLTSPGSDPLELGADPVSDTPAPAGDSAPESDATGEGKAAEKAKAPAPKADQPKGEKAPAEGKGKAKQGKEKSPAKSAPKAKEQPKSAPKAADKGAGKEN
ncbi:MAG: preprotein translocase subunit SecG [Verrucomicrobiales bacterium]|nr:preprotein translocase subunit SecG [Verrucomicrobiales bacterium]